MLAQSGRSRWVPWVVLAAILLVAAVVLVLSPAEQTLGDVVKVVYAHVALSRAGAVLFYLAGLLGLAVLVRPGPRLDAAMRAVGWAGLTLFTAGFLVSGVAQMLSWGGITWQEPRVAAGANVLAVAVIVQVAGAWLAWPRVRAVLRIALAAFQIWTSLRTPNVLHPGGAISESASSAIQFSNTLLFLLALALGAWIVWMFSLYRPANVPRE